MIACSQLRVYSVNCFASAVATKWTHVRWCISLCNSYVTGRVPGKQSLVTVMHAKLSRLSDWKAAKSACLMSISPFCLTPCSNASSWWWHCIPRGTEYLRHWGCRTQWPEQERSYFSSTSTMARRNCLLYNIFKLYLWGWRCMCTCVAMCVHMHASKCV